MKQSITTSCEKGTIQVLATGLQFPEGPAFAPDGSLWLVELKGESLVQYKDGQIQRFHVGGCPNGIAIDDKSNCWFCDAGKNQIRVFSPGDSKTITVSTHVAQEALAKPNDLAFDAMGNLVFTCPGDSRQEPDGYVCVLKKDGTIKKITTGKYFPNGLAFTPDSKRLVIAETYRHRLWIGDWDSVQASWTNEHVWCEIGGPDGPGGPDGMAFDSNGDLHVAVYGTGSIRVVDKSGSISRQILLPAQNPTNCAFDPSGVLGLVVTEAATGALMGIALQHK